MVLYRVMNEVFRSWTHVAVMRALFDTTNGLTGNAVARSAGMHPRSALKALTALEALHLVRRQRGGRDHIFTLNRKHFLFEKAILSVYSGERALRSSLEETLAGLLSPVVVSAIIFGSVARHEEVPGSDLDLCCITRTAADKDRIRDIVSRQALVLMERYGVNLTPLLFTVSEFRRIAGTALARNIIGEGKVIAGISPDRILHGKNRQTEKHRAHTLP
jgi:predicted nucleotidyltransferase